MCDSSYCGCGTVSRRKKETAGIGESQHVNHGKTDRNDSCKHTDTVVFTDTDSPVRKSSTTTQRTQKQDSTESSEKTDDSGDNNTQKDTEPATEEKTKEPETQHPTEEKTTPEATEGTTQNNTKATIKKIQ